MVNTRIITKISSCIALTFLCCLTATYKTGVAIAQGNLQEEKEVTVPSDKNIKDALADWAYDKHADLCLMLRDRGDGTLELIGKRNINVSIYEIGSYVKEGSYWPVKGQVSCDLDGTAMLLSPRGKFKLYKDKDGNWKAEEIT